MSVANAYFYSEKPLHARHTPHGSARPHSLVSADLIVSGRAVSAVHSGRDMTAVVRPPAHSPHTTTNATNADQLASRKVRRVHATTTSLPEYRTLSSASPRHPSTPLMGSTTDAPSQRPSERDIAAGGPISSASSLSLGGPRSSGPARLAYVLYTAQGSRPLAALTLSRLAGNTARRTSAATRDPAERPPTRPASSGTTTTTTTTPRTAVTALPSTVTLPSHMVDVGTGVRCVYVRDVQSQLLYLPPGASAELHAPPAAQSLSGRRDSRLGVPRRGSSPATSSTHTAAPATPSPAAATSAAPVLGIQLCLTPDAPEASHAGPSSSPLPLPYSLAIECTFVGGRRLVLSSAVTTVEPAHASAPTGGPRSHASAKVPLQCLAVGQWAVLYLDLESLQRTLFAAPSLPTQRTPGSASSPLSQPPLQSLRVLCGGRGACGVFLRRVVAMPAMPVTQPAQTERVLCPLTGTASASRSLATTTLLPDALRMPFTTTATTTTAATTMTLLFVRSGDEAVLTTPPPHPEVTEMPAHPVAQRAPLSCLSSSVTMDAVETVESTAPPPLPPAQFTWAVSAPQPTALAQLHAMLETEGPASRQTRAAEASQTISDVYERLSASASSSPPPVPPSHPPMAQHTEKKNAHGKSWEEEEDDEGGFHVERVAPATRQRHPAPHPDSRMAPVHALEASLLAPSPLEVKALHATDAPAPSDMLAVMHDRILRIHTVLRSGSRPRLGTDGSPSSRGASPSHLVVRAASAASAASAAPPRTPSAALSEDKAVQTDAWCALDHVGSRSRLSTASGYDGTSTPPPRTHAPHGGEGEREGSGFLTHPSHHYIPLSALKDAAGRPPHSSSTFFARPSTLFSMANPGTDDEDDESTMVAAAAAPVDDHGEAPWRQRHLYDSTPSVPVVPAEAEEAPVPFEAQPGAHRVLYHGDVPTPTLTSLAPTAAMAASSVPSHMSSLHAWLPPASQSAGLNKAMATTTATGGEGATAAASPAPRDDGTAQPSQSPSSASQGMTGSTHRGTRTTTTTTSPSQPVPTPDLMAVIAPHETADGPAEPLTQRVLDFWSSTEQPLSLTALSEPITTGATTVAAAGAAGPSSRPLTRHSRRRHRHGSHSGTPSSSVAPLGSARHEDPTTTTTVSSLTASTTAPLRTHSRHQHQHQPPPQQHEPQQSQPPRRPGSRSAALLSTRTDTTAASQVDQLVFNSAQYESVEAWAASLDEAAPIVADRDDPPVKAPVVVATRRATTTFAPAAAADHAPLPSHRSVFAKLRQHWAISSDSEVSATSDTAPPDQATASPSDNEEEGDNRPITVAALQSASPTAAADLAQSTNTARTSWTFHSTSSALLLRASQSGQSITHPWASSTAWTSATDASGAEPREEVEVPWVSTTSFSRDEAVHKSTPPPPPTSSMSLPSSAGLSALVAGTTPGAPLAKPASRRPTSGLSAATAAAASAALVALHNKPAPGAVDDDVDVDDDAGEATSEMDEARPPSPPRFSLYASAGPIVVPPTPRPLSASDAAAPAAPGEPAVVQAPSVAWQRAASARQAELLASHDAVRLGYEPLAASTWSADDVEGDSQMGGDDRPHTPVSQRAPAAAPTAEKRGTPLQWPLVRRSRLSGTGTGVAGVGAAGDSSHPRVGSARPPTTGDQTAGRLGDVEDAATTTAATATTTAVRRQPRVTLTPPLPVHASLTAAAAPAESSTGSRCEMEQEEGRCVSAATASATQAGLPFTYLSPSEMQRVAQETSPQALRYASAYSSCTSSQAPSAHANASTSDGGGSAAWVAPAPAVVVVASTDARQAMTRGRAQSGGLVPTSHPQYPLHRHYSLPHLTQYHRLRSAAPVQVRPTQSDVQVRLARAKSAVSPLTTTMNAAPEILLSPPHGLTARSPSLTSTVEKALASPASVSGRYMYDPVLDCYLDRHAHVYVQAEDVDM